MLLRRLCYTMLSLSCYLASAASDARTNVGLIDYAYVPPGSGGCTKLSSEKFAPGNENTYVVQKDSAYEVTLKHVRMDKFNADFWNRSKGEFAIVARAFEMSADPTNPAGGFNFRPDAANGGRVIYYSNDVWRNQSLNFGQIPMFGPVVYNGNPVGISVFVLEIDTANDNVQMGTLLSTLAGIGQLVSVPGSPVYSLLENLGSSLINANKDDLLMRYDTTFRSSQGSLPNIRTSLFRYGDYVLIRKEERDHSIDWKNYWYNPGNGIVYTNAACDAPLDGAYGVIQINRAHAPAFFQTELLGELLTAMSNAEEASQKPVADSVRAVADSLSSTKSYRKFIQLLDTLQDGKDADKPASPVNKATLASHLRDAKASIDLHAEGKPAKFTLKQLDQIIARLRRLTGEGSIDFEQFDPKAIQNSVH